jgi:hypothetical protein
LPSPLGEWVKDERLVHSSRTVWSHDVRKGTFRQSALVEIRIVAGHPWHSGIGPGPDRMIGVAVLSATDATDEMIGNLRHWQPLRQVETAGVDVEMPRRPA